MTPFTADFFRRAVAEWERFRDGLGRPAERFDEAVFIDWLRDHMDLSDHWAQFLRFHRVPWGLRSALRVRARAERPREGVARAATA